MKNSGKIKYSFITTAPIFDSRNPKLTTFRTKFWGGVIKIAVKLGYTVCLVGPARSGKSYLLEKNLSGQIIDARAAMQKNGWKNKVDFSLYGVKSGLIAIDETSYFEPKSLGENSIKLKKRGVVFTSQRVSQAKQNAEYLDAKNVLVIYVGTRNELEIDKRRAHEYTN